MKSYLIVSIICTARVALSLSMINLRHYPDYTTNRLDKQRDVWIIHKSTEAWPNNTIQSDAINIAEIAQKSIIGPRMVFFTKYLHSSVTLPVHQQVFQLLDKLKKTYSRIFHVAWSESFNMRERYDLIVYRDGNYMMLSAGRERYSTNENGHLFIANIVKSDIFMDYWLSIEDEQGEHRIQLIRYRLIILTQGVDGCESNVIYGETGKLTTTTCSTEFYSVPIRDKLSYKQQQVVGPHQSWILYGSDGIQLKIPVNRIERELIDKDEFKFRQVATIDLTLVPAFERAVLICRLHYDDFMSSRPDADTTVQMRCPVDITVKFKAIFDPTLVKYTANEEGRVLAKCPWLCSGCQYTFKSKTGRVYYSGPRRIVHIWRLKRNSEIVCSTNDNDTSPVSMFLNQHPNALKWDWIDISIIVLIIYAVIITVIFLSRIWCMIKTAKALKAANSTYGYLESLNETREPKMRTITAIRSFNGLTLLDPSDNNHIDNCPMSQQNAEKIMVKNPSSSKNINENNSSFWL
ncbi:hypothetical protein GJ496_003278 [Pomphorhynchus laevis]|nr:hypothetical protein GJ496_003278 [Pomphorhynchus laevis]